MTAFDPELVAKQAEHIRALARRLVFDSDDAEDVVQDACLAALRRPPAQGVSLRAWLVGVARNLAARTHRDARRRRRALEALAERRDAELSDDVDRRARLHRGLIEAVQRLPEPYATTLLLRYFDGLPPRVIAVRMGVPAATVSTRIHRGLERLRAQLAEEGSGRSWVPGLLPLAARPERGSSLALLGTGGVLVGIKSWIAVTAVALACVFFFLGPHGHEEAARDDPGASGAGAGMESAGLDGRGSEPTGALPSPEVDVLAKADRDLDLHGRVVDARGQPVAGASVETYTFPWQRASIYNLDEYNVEVPGPATTTSPNGAFSIRLQLGAEVNLRVRAAGYGERRIGDRVAGERLQVVLVEGGAARLRLVTEAGGPVPGVAVKLTVSHYSGATALEWAAESDAEGYAHFDGLRSGERHRVQASHPDLGSPPWSAIYPRAGETIERVIVLPTGKTVRGRVLDDETGEPIADARVGFGWTYHKEVRTDADGAYEMKGVTLESGYYELVAIAAGYASMKIAPPFADTVDFRLARGVPLSGRVLSRDGRPVADAFVAAVSGSYTSSTFGRTDEEGAFALAAVRRGTPHALVAYAAGYGRVVHDVVTSEGEEHYVGDILLPPPQTIAGVVLAPDGKPAAGVPVALTGTNANRDLLQPGLAATPVRAGTREVRRTDDLGRFVFPDLAAGSYQLQIQPPNRKWTTADVVLPAGRDVTGLALHLVGGHTLRVRLEDETGAPVSGANVTVSCEDLYQFGQFTDATGTFVIESDSPPTSVDVSVPFHPEAWSVPPLRKIEPGEKDVVVVLRRVGRVRGRVFDPDGKPLAQAVLEVLVNGKPFAQMTNFTQGQIFTNPEGRFVAAVPTAGNVEIRAMERGQPDRSIWGGRLTGVAAGDEDLELQLAPLAFDRALSIRVLRPDGRPAKDVQVYARVGGMVLDGANARTGADGKARFTGLPAGRIAIFARPTAETEGADGWLPLAQVVEPAGQEIELRFANAVLLRGRVVDTKGAGVAGATVGAWHGSLPPEPVTSDDEGWFVLRLHPEEPEPLHVYANLDTRQGMAKNVKLETEAFVLTLSD